LAFCAFKNHAHCFKLIFEHGCKYNLPLGPDLKPLVRGMQAWAAKQTDEQFTAIHFAAYHGNFELIEILCD
jgi:ankyrin repeat protein